MRTLTDGGDMIGQALRIMARTAAAITLTAALSACSGLAPHERSDRFTRHVATEVFSAGFEGIDAFHIDEPDIPGLALAGMQGLSRIDEAFGATRSADSVEITYNGRPIATFDAPRQRDVARWSELTSAVVSTARVASPAIGKADPETIYDAVFDGAFTRLDRFSRYAGHKEASRNRMSRNGYSGVGISFSRGDGSFQITDVIPDGPADKAGLRVGDRLTHVDGAPVAGLSADALADRLRGPSGSSINLTVSQGAASRTATLERATVIERTVHDRRVGDVLYLRITGFNDGTPSAVRRATIEQSAGIRGLAIDLRGNRGGVLEDAIALADLFITDGDILETRGRHRRAGKTYVAEEPDVAVNLPILVLTDGSSASASEIFAAAMQDSGRAVLIGARTFGKGSIQRIVTLPNEGEIYVTWSRMFAPSGYPLSDNGVLPTICTARLDGDVARIGERIRSGELLDASYAGVRLLSGSLDPRVRADIDARCRDRAPTPDGRDLDLDLALELLHKPDLYRRGIETSTLAMQDRKTR